MKFKFFIPPLIVVAALGFFVASQINAEPVAYTAPPETVRFKPGTNVVRAISHCSACHSADYVAMQPTLPRATWKGIVVKMQKVYGAPIPDAEIDPIVDYLVKTYGAEKEPSQK